LERQPIRPQIFNGSILTGLFLVTIIFGWLLTLFWSWFADFLAPVLTFPGVVAFGENKMENGFPFWLVISLGVAVAGWVYAYSRHIRLQHQVSTKNKRSSLWYVFFWNQGYFDQIYDAYLVTPTIRLAHWLWKTIDVRVIDKSVYFIANYSVYFARSLWRIVDIRWLERTVGQLLGPFNTDGQLKQEMQFSTLQHQVLVIIFWLVALTGLLYYLI
jgi:NADH:ubiquinone oxidoreductase subunit 5 (subunit L)/multisubunit Na+/H+ antiporter MnhA subunit